MSLKITSTHEIEVFGHVIECSVIEVIQDAINDYPDFLIEDAIVESLLSSGEIMKRCKECNEAWPVNEMSKDSYGDLFCPSCIGEVIRQQEDVDNTQRSDNNYNGRM